MLKNMDTIIVEYKPEEWIPLEKARMMYKGGRGIKPKSMVQRVRNKKVPAIAVHKTTRGNYWFHEPTLKGLTN